MKNILENFLDRNNLSNLKSSIKESIKSRYAFNKEIQKVRIYETELFKIKNISNDVSFSIGIRKYNTLKNSMNSYIDCLDKKIIVFNNFNKKKEFNLTCEFINNIDLEEMLFLYYDLIISKYKKEEENLLDISISNYLEKMNY